MVYKIQAANAITSQSIQAQFARTDPQASATLAVSVNHGATWTPLATLDATVGSAVPLSATVRDQVNGTYETLVRIQLTTASGTPDGRDPDRPGDTDDHAGEHQGAAEAECRPERDLRHARRPVGHDGALAGPQRGLLEKGCVRLEQHRFAGVSIPRKYTAVVYPAVLTRTRISPTGSRRPPTSRRLVYGGRLHNYQTGSYIDFLHSFDNGATWIRSYRLTDVSKPYDVIHYETVTAIPPGVRTVLFKYLIHNTNTTATRASGLYSVRMEVDHRPVNPTPAPIDVTLNWKEVRSDRTTVARSHHQRVAEFPFRYIVNVGGQRPPRDGFADPARRRFWHRFAIWIQ